MMIPELKKHDWLWLPTIYFTRGLPYVIVFLVSLVFYNRMGQSNGTITLNTSWFFIPFILRPIMGRVVTGFATKRFWILAMELLMAVCMFGVSQTISSKYWELLTMFFLFVTASASVVHDVAIARFYKQFVSPMETRHFSIHTIFLLVSIIVGWVSQ